MEKKQITIQDLYERLDSLETLLSQYLADFQADKEAFARQSEKLRSELETRTKEVTEKSDAKQKEELAKGAAAAESKEKIVTEELELLKRESKGLDRRVVQLEHVIVGLSAQAQAQAQAQASGALPSSRPRAGRGKKIISPLTPS